MGYIFLCSNWVNDTKGANINRLFFQRDFIAVAESIFRIWLNAQEFTQSLTYYLLCFKNRGGIMLYTELQYQ